MPPLRFHSLWAINGPLDVTSLCAQLDGFTIAGLDGVVFHPRFYPDNPPYLSDAYLEIVSQVILHAKDCGLSFWIYDENGWPSGTVGGRLLREHPGLAQRWAGLHRERPAHCLAEFEHDGCRWYLGEHIGAGVDYLNPALARHFIQLTYERYRTDLAAEAFAHVEAFFCDEPEFGLGHAHALLPPDGAIPWTPGLVEYYAAGYGEQLLPSIRDLFFTTERSPAIRVQFWELLRDRFCKTFLQPLNAWCESHGKRFTAHIKGEEHPLFQVPMVGSCSAVFRQLGLPGIDALERLPANDFYPRQVVSSAQQFGDGRCMAEAFGGAGWGATPEDLERYLLWLGGHGITDFVMHLSQYRLDSAAIRDWPPSQPFHLTWTEAYFTVLKQVRAKLAARPACITDTLVISPHRALMANYEPHELLATNIHNAESYPDSPASAINRRFLDGIASLQASGTAWHVTDEATFEAHARIESGVVHLGHYTYRNVLVSAGAQVNGQWPQLPEPGLVADANGEARNPVRNVQVPLMWRLASEIQNSLLLEPTLDTGYNFLVKFTVEDWFGPDLALRFVDHVTAASINGRPLVVKEENDARVCFIPAAAIARENEVRFHLTEGGTAPFVWLEGMFAVRSGGVFTSGPNLTLRTAGPFRVTAPTAEMPDEFVAAGYPFLRSPIEIHAMIELPAATGELRLLGVQADAAKVIVDGVDFGWIWGPDWEITADLAGGRHMLHLTLVPSSFNYFGPHHYYRGDAPVISPDQFFGRKNFADPAEAPDHTLTSDWHFVPMCAPHALAFSA
jgi:hypothetical protein